MTDYTEARLPAEQKWYALTGRVVDAKVEADGDIHLALQDADGKNAGTVSAEIPVGLKWCEIRQIVFGWTKQKFPFTVKSVHDLTIAEHVVTFTGNASTTSQTRQPMIQIGERRQKIRLFVKFIRLANESIRLGTQTSATSQLAEDR